MNQNDYLSIFGDSYACGSLHEGNPWPYLLAGKLNIDWELNAYPGTSTWWAYVKFMERYEKCNTIVFSYSQHNRWHHLSEECSMMHHLTIKQPDIIVPNSTPEREKIARILYDAYRYVSSEQLDVFIYQSIFDSVNKICRDNNIKLVNIMPFESDKTEKMTIDCSNRSGPVLYNLDGLTTLERSRLTKKQDQAFWDMICSGDKRPCHMNSHHNDLVANLVYELLQRDDCPIIDASKDPRASSDPIYNKMYYDL